MCLETKSTNCDRYHSGVGIYAYCRIVTCVVGSLQLNFLFFNIVLHSTFFFVVLSRSRWFGWHSSVNSLPLSGSITEKSTLPILKEDADDGWGCWNLIPSRQKKSPNNNQKCAYTLYYKSL